jgi:hypothetical protein
VVDTTTLYTTLHEEPDKSGTIIGAGILTLGVPDLAALLSTVRVTGTDSTAEKAATVAKFGKFFMGELWDSYGIETLKDAAVRRDGSTGQPDRWASAGDAKHGD